MDCKKYVGEYMKEGSYKGLVSKFSRKSNIDLIESLNNYISKYEVDFLSTSQKLYSVINDIKTHPLCYCGNKLKYKNLSIGYLQYCSNSCQVFSENTQSKIKETNILRYGVEHHTKTNEYRDEISKKCRKGEMGFGSDSYKESIRNKYGVSNISYLKGVSDKKRETWKSNWECLSDLERDEILRNKRIKYCRTVKKKFINHFNDEWEGEYLALDSNKYETVNGISIRGLYRILCLKCNEEFEILKSTLYQRKSLDLELCTNCNPLDMKTSKSEDSLYDFLSDMTHCIKNDRKILNGKEIDIYLPNEKVGIEYNGLYWHSELYKEDNYHLNKTKLGEEGDINIIHIFEDEWIFKKEIVKSRLMNILGLSDRIYARKCSIIELSNEVTKDFLVKNHLQGHVSSKYNIGLSENGKLVSIMTFGNLRKNLGSKKEEGSYELLRFCNLVNTTVVGGASKLFKYFIENYNPSKVISYADRRWSNGNLYENLGFDFIHDSSPSWTYPINGIRRNRFSFRKDVLVSKGYDENKTAREIMLDRGYYRVYDCGSKKYIYYV